MRKNYTPSNREEWRVCLEQVAIRRRDKHPSFLFVVFFGEEVPDILERQFQARLIRRIYEEMPDAIVLKTDPNYKQGFPDLVIFRGKNWAALEVKKEERAPHRPNQDFYIQKMNQMSFARFIYPENEEETLHDLRKILGAGRGTRVPESKPAPVASIHRRKAY